MIDTYIYFVSVMYYYKDAPLLAFGNSKVIRRNEIRSFEPLQEIENEIEKDIEESQNAKILGLSIINFQLLDSYNKEERGKDER